MRYPYASWNPVGEEMSVEAIVEQLLACSSAHVVLTGGEPMVAKGIHELAAHSGRQESTSPSKQQARSQTLFEQEHSPPHPHEEDREEDAGRRVLLEVLEEDPTQAVSEVHTA